ncbi:thiol:disulfide interchange protein DsbA/DsbL [Arenimonas caeni]|nr:thiol:disulfide interchange protein DsbA/DsbL [Arenimonas caeni]
MIKRLLPLLMVLALAACGEKAAEPAPAVEAPAVEAPAAEAPAAEPATPADETTEAAEDAAPAEAEASEPEAAAPAEAPAAATAEAPAPAPVAELPPMDPAKAPRRGVDYEHLPEPQPTMGQGGIEVAEVFSYMCIHCANLQPMLNTWKAGLPSDVRVVYVPGVFGGVSDDFARGFYAAEAVGLLDKTHDDLFKAVLIERKFQTGSAEEIAGWYATHGADRSAFLSTMQSFAVTTKINRARQFALRAGVDSTPTIIVAGKYKVNVTGDRGMEGLLDTVDWIVAHERAGKPMP